MKLKHIIAAALGLGLMATAASCQDDDLKVPGNPQIDYTQESDAVHFGDSLSFTVKASDQEVPLSTLKARLYFGDEMVQETVIRTKESGKDYTGKIYVPYFANVPDGKATLKLVLQNIHFTITEQSYEVPVTHADYPYLTLRATTGEEYRMQRTAADTYVAKDKFPQKFKGYIVTPKVGKYGNELVFGYADNAVAVGSESPIPFSSSRAGKFEVSLNTRTFEAAPFVVFKANGVEFASIDDNTAKVDLSLSRGDAIALEGFPNIGDWWIDPDWFDSDGQGNLKFKAIGGQYRIIADAKLQYFRVEALRDGTPVSLQADGSGALWAIGEGFGKPGVATNQVGWTTEKAICLAPVADKVYQLTLVGGKTVSVDNINFKFFSEAMGWGDELDNSKLTSTSSLVLVGDGTGGHDKGNLYLAAGAKLKDNVIYVFTVDCSKGRSKSVLSVKEMGVQPFVEKPVTLNGKKMTTGDNNIYRANVALKAGGKLQFSTSVSDMYFDPDYFTYDADNDEVVFNALDGYYNIQLDKLTGYVKAERTDASGADATLGSDGHGAVWMMGWGVGSPSLDNQFGWTPGAAYCMAEVKPKVYQFTGVAGPEKGSGLGQRIRTDYISCKFFHQNGWGGEFSGANAVKLAPGTEKFVQINGNIELAAGFNFEANATYVFTLDLTKGNSNAVLTVVKK